MSLLSLVDTNKPMAISQLKPFRDRTVTARMTALGLIRSVVVLVSVLATHAFAQSTSKYVGQVLVQRTFYGGSHLVFDDRGNPSKKYATCSWTWCAKIRVVDIRVHGETLHIRGQRLFLVADRSGHGYVDVFSDPGFAAAGESFERLKRQREVEIEVRGYAGWNDTAVAGVLAKIFLTMDESLNDFLPDYWKGCEFGKPNRPCEDNPLVHSVPKVGGGITPPRPLHKPDPKYSEVARLAKYQGTTVLWVIITPQGRPSNIKITRPLGLGLDDEAVRAVSGWKLEPAKRAGEPVAVQIHIEVNFRLY